MRVGREQQGMWMCMCVCMWMWMRLWMAEPPSAMARAHPGEKAREVRLNGRLGRRPLEEEVVAASLELRHLCGTPAIANPSLTVRSRATERALRRKHRQRQGRLRGGDHAARRHHQTVDRRTQNRHEPRHG